MLKVSEASGHQAAPPSPAVVTSVVWNLLVGYQRLRRVFWPPDALGTQFTPHFARPTVSMIRGVCEEGVMRFVGCEGKAG